MANLKAAISPRGLLLALIGLIQSLSLYPFLRSSWNGDDWPNSQTPYWIMWRYGHQSFSRIIQEALFWNSQWMHGNGRFYPLAFIESRIFFGYFRTQIEYKFLQVFLLELSILLIAYWMWCLSHDTAVVIFTILSSSVFLQGRSDFDPHVGFSMLLPSLIIKVTIAAILTIKAKESQNRTIRYLYSFLSALIYFAALCTYEYAFLLLPMIIFSTFDFELRNWRHNYLGVKRNLNLVILPILAWIGYAIFVFGFVRRQATAISGAYVLGLSWKSVSTFLINLTAWIPGISYPKQIFSTNEGTQMTCVLIILICLMFVASRQFKKHSFQEAKLKEIQGSGSIVAVTILFMIAPSFMLAIQNTWWDRIAIGHSYLGVMIQEIGASMATGFLMSRRNSLKISKIDKIKIKSHHERK
jgi:hypothetical protein